MPMLFAKWSSQIAIGQGVSTLRDRQDVRLQCWSSEFVLQRQLANEPFEQ